MNSHDLGKLLLSNPPVELLIQKDDEGNGYRRLNGADFEVAVTDDLDVYSLDWTADQCCLDEEDWEELKNKGKQFAIIW